MTTTSAPGAGADATPESIARWMLDCLEMEGRLYQYDAATGIEKTFGPGWLYFNDNGNPAIDRRILRAFRKISEDAVVWDRWDFCWRERGPGDAAGRKQE